MTSHFASELVNRRDGWLCVPEGLEESVCASRANRIILMEMESHDAAWPFLEPVNPRLVSGYRRVIKNPMDFSTMRERLLRGG